jgi:rare lipoprotein A
MLTLMRRALTTLPIVLLAAGCATRAPDRDAERDGPPADPVAAASSIRDVVPRVEPIRQGGPNKPYAVFGRSYVPMTLDRPFSERGLASWYGRKFQGRPTASGEPYDLHAMTAAHKTMPIPSYAVVRNPANGREVVVRVNDRGPFVDGRVIDLSWAAAVRLGVLTGVAPVEVRRLTHDEIRAAAQQ